MYLKHLELSTKTQFKFRAIGTNTEKKFAGTTAVHLGNSQSCGQLSNKYTNFLSSATEKQKLLHGSQSEQQKPQYTNGMLEVEIKTHNPQDRPSLC